MDRFGLDIYDLEAHLNKKVKASDFQSPIIMYTSQLVEKTENFHPFNYSLSIDVSVEEEY